MSHPVAAPVSFGSDKQLGLELPALDVLPARARASSLRYVSTCERPPSSTVKNDSP